MLYLTCAWCHPSKALSEGGTDPRCQLRQPGSLLASLQFSADYNVLLLYYPKLHWSPTSLRDIGKI